ncbi:YkgJ family cysteine cluster protein [Maribacter aquivivus]|uniref:Putative zinc-or iron-chelating domain-containing protein n=1 Tax=Maribacter aquivivus TaxID=228958 RepID=A0A1M6RGB3_9FLAO|nr:YkgJ family cysteine cluster protein [Maribacter aquivivus]SHK31492.1 Putative zinc-or iron-chelating domain-containing protein [Maribacter aquivivus]
MTLYQKVQAVNRIFNQLDKDLDSFQNSTGLSCVANCGLCCLKPDINATALEFLPLAYHLLKNGEAEEWLEDLQNDKDNKICPVLNKVIAPDSKGFCSEYAHRGLICRLFGFSAMLHKNNTPTLVTCKPIKEQKTEAFNNAKAHIAANKKYPLISNYYMQLRSIDESLGEELFPIRIALEKAIYAVLGYYAYRRAPRKGKVA